MNTNSVVRFGNAPRVDPNLRQDAMDNWDFSISKRTAITEQVNLQFTAEFYNTFNHTRFASPVIFANVPNFGIVTSQANQPRAIQFGLRVGF